MARLVIPTDARYNAAVGKVALANGHLDLVQRFLVRALADVDMRVALDSTEGSRMPDVQDRVKKLAKERKLPESVKTRLEACLNNARTLSRKRHELVHRAVRMDKDGNIFQKRDDHTWGKAPTVTELNKLSKEILRLSDQINEERLTGFIRDSCDKYPLPNN